MFNFNTEGSGFIYNIDIQGLFSFLKKYNIFELIYSLISMLA